MKNNIHRNQKLVQDKLILERLFLLDIEQQQSANTIQTNQQSDQILSSNDKIHPQQRKPISLVSIYAIVVTLLLLFPSNSDRANSKTVVVDHEPIKLLEIKLEQVEARTELLASEIATSAQDKVPVVSNVELALVPAPPPLVKSKSTVNTRIYDNQLALLPVPVTPSFVTQSLATSSTQLNYEKLPPHPPLIQPEPKLEIESKIEVFKTTVKKEEQPAEQWLGQANVVYYSFSSDKSEEPSSVSTNETEEQLLSDEDLKQYLISTPLSKDKAVEFESVNSDFTIRDSQEQFISDAQQQSTISAANSPEPTQSLFDDEDLAKYLDSTPLLDDDVLNQILGTTPNSTELEAKAEILKTADQVENSTITNNNEPEAQNSLFDAQDLRQFLTSTPLFSDDILKQKLN